MSAARAVDDLLVTAEGYDRLCSALETLRTEGRRAMSERQTCPFAGLLCKPL